MKQQYYFYCSSNFDEGVEVVLHLEFYFETETVYLRERSVEYWDETKIVPVSFRC